MSTIDDVYTKSVSDSSEEENVELGLEIKQFQDEDGSPFYAKTHMDAIDGFEEYTEGLTQLAYLLGDYITDSGWKPYDYGAGDGVQANNMYASDGFKCGIREITFNPYSFGNGNQVKIKMIRVNLRNFLTGQQIAQLPIGFMSSTQVFHSRSGSGRQPIMVELRGDGKVNVNIDGKDIKGDGSDAYSNWIYAQHTWIE